MLSTTGIGSLPHLEPERALELAFEHDVPFLPQLPGMSPAEAMIPAALGGLPGLGDTGIIDVDAWRRGRDGFGSAIERALGSGKLEAFEPSNHACFRPFLREVERRKLPVAKVQLAGPATVRWVAKTSSGEPASMLAELDQQIFRLALARTLALVHAVGRTGATPLIFIDEPGLGALNAADPRHAVVLQELRVLIAAAQKQQAVVGLHCCANTDWEAVLGLGFDVLSFDARLSLDAVLEERTAVRAFLGAGSIFALGAVPTDPGARYLLGELVESIEASWRATIPRFEAILPRMMITAACGLGMRSVTDAERIVEEVRDVQRGLKAIV